MHGMPVMFSNIQELSLLNMSGKKYLISFKGERYVDITIKKIISKRNKRILEDSAEPVFSK